LAIEEHTLARVRAQPELQADREHEADTFAVEIRFTKPLTCMERNRRGQIELDLDR
jgi:hypothetical protein